MDESVMIKELNITEKQFKMIYDAIQENNSFIVKHAKLKKQILQIEDNINTNNIFISDLMQLVPSYYNEASLSALYEDFISENK